MSITLVDEQILKAWRERSTCNRLHEPPFHNFVTMCEHDLLAFAREIETAVIQNLRQKVQQRGAK